MRLALLLAVLGVGADAWQAARTPRTPVAARRCGLRVPTARPKPVPHHVPRR
ncbi:MAG: hypothetical protein IPJ65_34670 [Archangiaceae bacterium]|nr:hypothetical protein [Archangiaceae bacterium]